VLRQVSPPVSSSSSQGSTSGTPAEDRVALLEKQLEALQAEMQGVRRWIDQRDAESQAAADAFARVREELEAG
jgi:hypothetical protein